MPKFAVHILVFNVQNWMHRLLENCGPHVDKIYIAYSRLPFSYNPLARKNFVNTFHPDFLKDSPYFSKITFIEGDWHTEDDQRNTCLKQARADGMDYLIIQDHDEFYFADDYEQIKKTVSQNPQYDYFMAPWYIFWKSFKYLVVDPKENPIWATAEIVVNCKTPVVFNDKRKLNSKNFMLLDQICFHGSFVLTDLEVFEKIATWSHTMHFDRSLWFLIKWLNWKPKTKCIYPTIPGQNFHAIEYTKALPDEIKNYEVEIVYRNFFSSFMYFMKQLFNKYFLKKS
jgi:hypothetical protein